MMKKVLSLILTLTMVLSLMAGVCISVGAEEYTKINEASITGTAIPELSVGDTLPALSYEVPASANYTVTACWLKDGSDVAAGAVVEDGHAYTLQMRVVANDGYAFDQNNCPLLINGEEYSFFAATDRGENGFAECRFTKDYSFQQPIDKVEAFHSIPEVGKALGEITIPAGVNYTLLPKWCDCSTGEYIPGDTVAAKGEVYAAQVRLIPAVGYEFTEDTEVWINGELVDAVGIEFDMINYWSEHYNFGDPVAEVHLNHNEPELDKVLPQASIPAGVNYTMDARWYNYNAAAGEEWQAAGAVAAKGGRYELNVNIYPADGYKFTEDTKIYINGTLCTEDDGTDLSVQEDGIYYCSDVYSFTEKLTAVSFTLADPVVGQPFPQAEAPEGAKYEVYTEWYNNHTGEYDTGNVQDGYSYEVCVSAYPASGYEFAEDMTLTVNGSAVKKSQYYCGDDYLHFYRDYSFAKTVAKVELPAWPQLKVGDTLPEISGSGDHYTYEILFEAVDANGDPLTGDTVQDASVYAAIICAVPEAGYEFTGDTVFTVGGKMPSNWAEQGYVQFTDYKLFNFGGTKLVEEIKISATIPGIGQKGGDVTFTNDEGYEVEMAEWGVASDDSLEDADFATEPYKVGDHVLIAFELSAKDGYFFSENAVITFGGKEYKPVSMIGNPTSVYVVLDLGEIKKPSATPETGDTTPVVLLSFLCLSTLAGISILLSKKRIAR